MKKTKKHVPLPIHDLITQDLREKKNGKLSLGKIATKYKFPKVTWQSIIKKYKKYKLPKVTVQSIIEKYKKYKLPKVTVQSIIEK